MNAAKNREIKHSYLGDMMRRLDYFETVLGAIINVAS